jgi:hypothetical protein
VIPWQLSEFDRGYHTAMQDLLAAVIVGTEKDDIVKEVNHFIELYADSPDNPPLLESFPKPMRRRSDGRAIPRNP